MKGSLHTTIEAIWLNDITPIETPKNEIDDFWLK